MTDYESALWGGDPPGALSRTMKEGERFDKREGGGAE